MPDGSQIVRGDLLKDCVDQVQQVRTSAVFKIISPAVLTNLSVPQVQKSGNVPQQDRLSLILKNEGIYLCDYPKGRCREMAKKYAEKLKLIVRE
jgi:hypothetical protein